MGIGNFNLKKKTRKIPTVNISLCYQTFSSLQASFLGTDILMNPERIPPLVKDYYWDKQDCPIPYTEAAIQFKKKTYRGSADEIT